MISKGYHPYAYGYPWETKVKADFTEETTKLYAHGRQSYEMSYVMPDEKTVYSTDDGTNCICDKNYHATIDLVWDNVYGQWSGECTDEYTDENSSHEQASTTPRQGQEHKQRCYSQERQRQGQAESKGRQEQGASSARQRPVIV